MGDYKCLQGCSPLRRWAPFAKKSCAENGRQVGRWGVLHFRNWQLWVGNCVGSGVWGQLNGGVIFGFVRCYFIRLLSLICLCWHSSFHRHFFYQFLTYVQTCTEVLWTRVLWRSTLAQGCAVQRWLRLSGTDRWILNVGYIQTYLSYLDSPPVLSVSSVAVSPPP